MIGVVSSVYFWGMPLIQKNKDVSLLENTEAFMLNLNSKIKDITNHGGRDTIELTLPGIVRFNGENITLSIDTTGSIYAEGTFISLSRNGCSMTEGVWGINNPETLCLKTVCTGGGANCQKYHTEYKLSYIRLDTEGINSYKIRLSGDVNMGGEHSFIQIENKGTTEEIVGGRKLISTEIEISIL